MNISESQQVAFRPRARLLSLLGEQLISDQTVGLLELVKNAYDADATQVEIELLGLSSPDTTRITICDNGTGMTRIDVEQKWLSPAIDHKEKQKKARKRSRLGRLPIGEKGVGRFAARQLGHKFKMISRAQDMPEIVVEIDWDDFDREEAYLSDIKVTLYEHQPEVFTGDKTGTLLNIEQARSPWSESQVARLQRALRRLQSPHQGQNKIDFHIIFRCPDFPMHQDISNTDILEHAHYIMEGLVTEEGLLDYEYTCHHPAVPERSMSEENYNLLLAARYEMFSPGKNSCGPFYLSFYVWDRTQEYLNQSGISRADLDAMAGVSIWRDCLRVLPYGEPGNDWLDLDKERINAPSERIGKQQIIGLVDVFQEQTLALQDKTNREGLIDNAAFQDLRALVRAAINVFTSQWLQDRQRMERNTATKRREPTRDSLQKAQIIAETVKATAREDIIVKIETPVLPDSPAFPVPQPPGQTASAKNTTAKTEQETAPAGLQPVEQQLTQRQAMNQLLTYLRDAADYQDKSEAEEEQRNQMLMHLAATGMAAERVAHEFGRQVNAAMNALQTLHRVDKIDNNAAEALRILEASIGTLRNEFRVLAPYEAGWHLQRSRLISVRESAELAWKLNEHFIKVSNIVITLEGNDFEVMARPSSLVQILDNLIHNACIWLAGIHGQRQITVTFNKDMYTVIVADNGPGIPSHMRENIFKPFVSMRN